MQPIPANVIRDAKGTVLSVVRVDAPPDSHVIPGPGETMSRESLVPTADGGLVLDGDYRALRRAEYPAIGDQIDTLWKALAALDPARATLPSEAGAMLDAIGAVKTRHPKV